MWQWKSSSRLATTEATAPVLPGNGLAQRFSYKSLNGVGIAVRPPGIMQLFSFPAKDSSPAGSVHSAEMFYEVWKEKQSVAKDTKIRSAYHSNKEDLSSKTCNDPLSQLMIEAGTASREEMFQSFEHQ